MPDLAGERKFQRLHERAPSKSSYWVCNRWTAAPLTPGKHELKLELIPESPKPGAPASVKLSVDGELSGETHIKRQVPQRCGTETLDIGMDCVSSVCDEYHSRGLFPFNGVIESVTIEYSEEDRTTGMDRLEMATKLD